MKLDHRLYTTGAESGKRSTYLVRSFLVLTSESTQINLDTNMCVEIKASATEPEPGKESVRAYCFSTGDCPKPT